MDTKALAQKVIALDIGKAQKPIVQDVSVPFEELIVQHRSAMYKVALAIVRNREDAADAVQEATFKAFCSFKNLREIGLFKTWITRILINECNRILRSQRKILPLLEDINADGKDAMSGIDDLNDVTRALLQLDDDLRKVITLHYYQDLPLSDISKILRIPEGTVKSRLHRAREILYEKIEL